MRFMASNRSTGLPFTASSIASALFMLRTATWSDERFAFLIRLLNVGINTAAKIAMTATTMTSSTMVKPFFLFNFMISSPFYDFFERKRKRFNSEACNISDKFSRMRAYPRARPHCREKPSSRSLPYRRRPPPRSPPLR